MTVLVTGAAGFIGYHLANKLLDTNQCVVGIDNFNEYYDVQLKNARYKKLLEKSKKNKCNFTMINEDISNEDKLKKIFWKL